jgi:3-dehydroquinate synthase
MTNRELCIKHAKGSYLIKLGESFDSACLQAAIAGRKVCIVTNKTVALLYLEALKTAIQGEPVVCELPDGEQYKTLEHWMSIMDTLTASQCHRDSVIVALGGGVVGDMAGFAAASYQRGIDYIHVPTTLLSQVDSSIGGKTAINHPAGKNLIGAFWQPKLVLINTRTLQSLPKREYCSGFAEIIKAGIIADESLLELLESESEALLQQDFLLLQAVIESACLVKQRIVQVDEQEKTGQRALLNLGHTFAHAIEHYLGYGQWLHGEAVGLGLVLAASFAAELGLCEQAFSQHIRHIVGLYGLPTSLPRKINCAKLCSIMALDKKTQHGSLRIVLPRSAGKCELRSMSDCSINTMTVFLEHFQRVA